MKKESMVMALISEEELVILEELRENKVKGEKRAEAYKKLSEAIEEFWEAGGNIFTSYDNSEYPSSEIVGFSFDKKKGQIHFSRD